MENQAGIPAKKRSTCGIILACVIGFFMVIFILGTIIDTTNQAERADFVASLDTAAFDGKTLFGADRSKAEVILGAPMSAMEQSSIKIPDTEQAALIIAADLNAALAGTTSTFWKKEDFIVWTTSLKGKPIDQLCVIDPNSKHTTPEILKKVSLASSTEDYSILGMSKGNGFCACIKKSQNPLCKEQTKVIAKKKAEQEKIDKVCAEHPSWDRDICEIVANKKVRVGMTQEQVLASVGLPTDINQTIQSGGVDQQWVYGLGSYLYFSNGILRIIQN